MAERVSGHAARNPKEESHAAALRYGFERQDHGGDVGGEAGRVEGPASVSAVGDACVVEYDEDYKEGA